MGVEGGVEEGEVGKERVREGARGTVEGMLRGHRDSWARVERVGRALRRLEAFFDATCI